MNWKAHAAIAFICTTALFYFLSDADIVHLILLGIFAAISALIPDMDLPQSKARSVSDVIVVIVFILVSYFSFCGWAFCFPGLNDMLRIAFLALILLGIYFLAMKFIMPRHRGFTHSLVACLVSAVLAYLLFGIPFAIAGFVGYLSHLIADKEIKML